MSPVIDAHHHFWVYGQDEQSWRGPSHDGIARDYAPDDLRPCLAQAGVDATVLIQSVDTAAENARMLAYAAEAGFVAGIVAWLPLQSPDPALRELSALTADPLVRGVRCLIGRSDTGWLTEPATLEVFRALAVAGLSWDVVPVTADQVRDVLGVARAVPELRIVIDHLGRPPIDTGGWLPWADQVRELAALPNLAVKVSIGIDILTDWTQWTTEPIARYVGLVAEQFGPRRMLLASNWPVVLLRRNYLPAWTDLRSAVESAGIRGADLQEVLGGAAARWYRLTV